MSIELGNVAQWASALIAAGSLAVAIRACKKAEVASKEANSVRLSLEDMKVQIAQISVRSGGSGGTGGHMGGGGGGGGGSGQAGGDGGDFHVHS